MSAETRIRFSRIVTGAGGIDLAEANLLIAAEAAPGLDVAAGLAAVDELAGAVGAEGVVATLREEGFRGDDTDYHDPRNSFLDQILERRRGLPIGLSTLALALARRTGAPMAGIGMPGHFLVADLAGGEPRYIDPYHGWRELSVDDCAGIVRQTTGLAMRPEFLAPVPERAVLTRTLANLRGSYMRRTRLEDALWTVELALIVTPDDQELEGESVALLAAVGHYARAEAAAEALLAAWPPDSARVAIEAQLVAIRDLQRRMN